METVNLNFVDYIVKKELEIYQKYNANVKISEIDTEDDGETTIVRYLASGVANNPDGTICSIHAILTYIEGYSENYYYTIDMKLFEEVDNFK